MCVHEPRDLEKSFLSLYEHGRAISEIEETRLEIDRIDLVAIPNDRSPRCFALFRRISVTVPGAQL